MKGLCGEGREYSRSGSGRKHLKAAGVMTYNIKMAMDWMEYIKLQSTKYERWKMDGNTVTRVRRCNKTINPINYCPNASSKTRS